MTFVCVCRAVPRGDVDYTYAEDVVFEEGDRQGHFVNVTQSK